MIYVTLTSITILFFTYALVISPFLKKHLGIKLCAICTACSTTWMILLLLRTFNILEIDNTLIGVLMGGSVVGVMYLLVDSLKNRGVKSTWIVKLLEVIVGFYLAYSVATMNQQMVIISLIGILFVILVSFVLIRSSKSTKRKAESGKRKAVNESEKQDAIKKLEKSLEDCC